MHAVAEGEPVGERGEEEPDWHHEVGDGLGVLLLDHHAPELGCHGLERGRELGHQAVDERERPVGHVGHGGVLLDVLLRRGGRGVGGALLNTHGRRERLEVSAQRLGFLVAHDLDERDLVGGGVLRESHGAHGEQGEDEGEQMPHGNLLLMVRGCPCRRVSVERRFNIT